MRPEIFQPRFVSSVSGYTLIELLVASTLGLLLLLGVGTLFINTNRSYKENELITGMQDQARFALSTLSRDFALAGYWGGMQGSINIVPNLQTPDTEDDYSNATTALTSALDCGQISEIWSFKLHQAVEFRNHNESEAISAKWKCIGNHVAGTDAVAIRHVSAQETGEMASGDGDVLLRPYHFYLQSNGTVGTLTRWGSAARNSPDPAEVPASAPMTFYRYTPRIYFIRDFSVSPGDGIPTLCRKALCPSQYAGNGDPELASCNEAGGTTAALGYYSECIAEGIEDMQITWGLDTDGDFVVDRYETNPSLAQHAQFRSAIIQLLVRSRSASPNHVDSKTYTLAGKSTFTPSSVTDPDGTPAKAQTKRFFRRVYSTTVQLRNMGIHDGSGIQ